jgi:hypothetical protein
MARGQISRDGAQADNRGPDEGKRADHRWRVPRPLVFPPSLSLCFLLSCLRLCVCCVPSPASLRCAAAPLRLSACHKQQAAQPPRGRTQANTKGAGRQNGGALPPPLLPPLRPLCAPASVPLSRLCLRVPRGAGVGDWFLSATAAVRHFVASCHRNHATRAQAESQRNTRRRDVLGCT